MQTTVSMRTNQPSKRRQSPREFARSRAAGPQPGRRPLFSRTSPAPGAKGPAGQTGRRSQLSRPNKTAGAKGPSGLIGRARTGLPGRKPPSKKSPLEGALSSLGSAKNKAAARKPSKKSAGGIVAGGLGLAVAVLAKRRRAADQDEMPAAPPVGASEGMAMQPGPKVLPVRPVEPEAVEDTPPMSAPVKPEQLGETDAMPPKG